MTRPTVRPYKIAQGKSEGCYERVSVRVDRLEAERDQARRLLDEAVTRAQRYEMALRAIRAELAHGVTANWEYIEKRFAEALDD